MRALREHVNGLDSGGAVGGQELDVAGEGGGIAADVNEAGEGEGVEGCEDAGVAAFAWRVEDDGVISGVMREVEERVLDARTGEGGAGKVIAGGVFARV